VLERRRAELQLLERDLSKLERVVKPFPRISYDDAIAKLKTKGFAVNWGDDLGGDEETAVSEDFDRPVMIHRYPSQSKAFYMKQDPARPEVALCVICSPWRLWRDHWRGQREDDYETLKAKIQSHQLPLRPFNGT
jgi:asparaginyl-tRNA synthetase